MMVPLALVMERNTFYKESYHVNNIILLYSTPSKNLACSE